MADVAVALAALALLTIALFAGIRRLLLRPETLAHATIVDPEEHTTMDERGAVRSVQSADITLPAAALERLWNPMHLERLARTYWRYLTHFTLGLIRVKYEQDGRSVVLLTRPFVLLRFKAPEYEMGPGWGRVRWRIASGVLVSRRTPPGAEGWLQIEVRRCGAAGADSERVHVEVEVANFYPALASAVARWFYSATQSRIHVIVTHGFLRSLARLDLARSVVGRWAPEPAGDLPDPAPEEQTAA